MKQTRFIALFAMLFAGTLIARPTRLFADFDDLGAGARAIGLGNAYSAVADDAFGLYYNPAGLGFIRTGQVGADFGKLYAGLDDNSNLVSGFGAIAIPMLKARLYDMSLSTAASRKGLVESLSLASAGVSTGTLAGMETSTTTAKITYYEHLGTIAVGWKYFSLVDYYQEAAYYLSYGRPVANKWAWGINLKYLQEKYVMDDYLKASPVFQYGKKDSVAVMSADLGVIYNLAPRLFLGASLTDINQPSTGLLAEDKIPYGLRLGMAWKERGLCWTLDTQYRRNQWYYMTGFERYLTNMFGLRAGIGMGGHNYFNIAAGFTVNLYRAELDYVFQYPLAGIKDISGTHRMSFVFRFGRRGKDETEIGSIEYYYSKLQDEVENVRQRFLQTKNEKENLESILLEEATLRIRERIKAAKAEAARMTTTERVAPVVERKVAESHEPKEMRHTVKPGETLQSIAEKYYGATKYWDEIYQANKDSVGRGGVVKPNQVLIIPQLSKQDGEADEKPVQTKTAARSAESVAAPAAAAPKTNVTRVRSDEIKPIAAVGDKVTPIKVITSPTGMGKEKYVPITVNTAELEMVGRKRESPRLAAAAGKNANVSRRHIVQPGENLRSIAQKYYNDSNRWKEIYQANRDKVISGQVSPGQEIVIP
jgi:nucleoid-associated protein YgaU